MKLLKIFIFGLVVILISRFVYSQGWVNITISNTQSQATPAPFQQDIAICNGNQGLGSNFAYVNDPTLFNLINDNGSNIYFTTTYGGSPNIYSWYAGQSTFAGATCDVWWVNIPNGIPANGNIVIYMAIGNYNTNYYSQYYPYVGTNEQVIGTMQYDNGQDVFIAYGDFDNTFDGWSGYTYNGSYSPTATPNGIEMINNNPYEGTYILPPNNGNIPKIPLIVEEAWYFNGDADANVIALFGNTNQQIKAGSIGSTSGGGTPVDNLSTFLQLEYLNGYTYLKSAVTDQSLNEVSGLSVASGAIYSYLIVNSAYAKTGNYLVTNQVWIPLSFYLSDLDTSNAGMSYNLNYNPFQYGTLEISAGDDYLYTSYQYIEWVIARALTPNGVMPSISIQAPVSISSVQLNPSSSSPVCLGTQTQSTVTANLNNPYGVSTTVTFSCSASSGITCSFSQSSCTTSGSSCSTTLYVDSSSSASSGSYSVTVTASAYGTSALATYTYNIGPNISISSQSSSNFQNSYNIYITGCSQNYTLYTNNSPYCYDSYAAFQVINSECTLSNPGSYSVYAQGCYNGNCSNSNTINLNIPSSGGITVPIIGINILNVTNQNINTTISVNGSNQNIQSINVYYNNSNVYSNSNVNTNYYSFNLNLPYSNNGNITACSTLTNGQSGCVIQLLYFNIIKIVTYYGIIVG